MVSGTFTMLPVHNLTSVESRLCCQQGSMQYRGVRRKVVLRWGSPREGLSHPGLCARYISYVRCSGRNRGGIPGANWTAVGRIGSIAGRCNE